MCKYKFERVEVEVGEEEGDGGRDWGGVGM